MRTLLPHDAKLEEALISEILLRPDKFSDVSIKLGDPETWLQPDGKWKPGVIESPFYIHRHHWMYEAIHAVHKRTGAVDILLLKSELEQRQTLEKVGGVARLAEMFASTGHALHILSHALELRQLAWRRAGIRKIEAMGQVFYSDETDIQTVAEKTNDIWNSGAMVGGRKHHTADVMYRRFHDRFADRVKNAEAGHPNTGLKTGLSNLDRLFGPVLDFGNLLFLQGLSGVGKSWAMEQIATNLSLQGIPVLYLTFEGMVDTFEDRTVAMASGVPYARIQSGVIGRTIEEKKRNEARVVAAANQLSQTPIEVVDDLSTTDEIENHIKEMMLLRTNGRPPYVFVDNANNIVDAFGDSYEGWGVVTSALTTMCRQLGVGIMAGAQMRNDIKQEYGDDLVRKLSIPTMRTIEGSRKGPQQARGVFGIVSSDYIRREIIKRKSYEDPNCPRGMVQFVRCKASDYKGPGSVLLRWNDTIPRYEMVEPNEMIKLEVA